MKNTPVLTIAGFDPSGCAGILADIKTFEAHKVYAMAVSTANTIQSVNEFDSANWQKPEEILTQLRFLQKQNCFDFVKIGLIENFNLLNVIMDELISANGDVKIIWDPVCKASASFEFHSHVDKNQLESICSKIFLITPNMEELAVLVPDAEPEMAGKYLSQFCSILIKGGHRNDHTSTDMLYQRNSVKAFYADKLENFSKRGTGCVLSASILANLANGRNLVESCELAKRYIEKYLLSNNTHIGEHTYEIS